MCDALRQKRLVIVSQTLSHSTFDKCSRKSLKKVHLLLSPLAATKKKNILDEGPAEGGVAAGKVYEANFNVDPRAIH